MRNLPRQKKKIYDVLWFLWDHQEHRIETMEIAEELDLERKDVWRLCRKLQQCGMIRQDIVNAPRTRIALWSINLRAPKKPDHKDGE